jgi:hypothetical protein
MYKYSAVIIEPRRHKALAFVLHNFLKNLSDEWGIIIFHGNKNKEYVCTILNTTLSIYKSRITLHNLNINNLTITGYNALLRSLNFYDKIPTETFLVFQTDTMIIEKNKELLNNFLQYDYVGAPWSPSLKWTKGKYKVGNGGLSLRKKSKMIEILKTSTLPPGCNEDVFFSYPQKSILYKPSSDEAKKFSIESIFSDITFGCHKPWVHIDKKILFSAYPEIKELYMLQSVE